MKIYEILMMSGGGKKKPLVYGTVDQSGGTFSFYLNRTSIAAGGTTITVPVDSKGYWEWSNEEGINITSLKSMFYNKYLLTDVSFSEDFDTSNNTSISYMFYGCSKLTSLDLSNWNTSNVTDMSYMFSSCSALKTVDLSNWDTNKVRNISYMFRYSSALTYLKLDNWTTTQVTSYNTFVHDLSTLAIDYNSSKWNPAIPAAFPLVNWGDISPATMDIYGTGTFKYSYRSGGVNYLNNSIALGGKTTPTKIDLGINKNFEYFRPVSGQTNIVKIDMTGMTGAKPTSCEQMFSGMNSLTNIVGLDGLDYSRTTNTDSMFSNIYGLDAATGTAIGNMNLGESLTQTARMFNGLTTTALDLNFDTKNVWSSMYLLAYCNTPVVHVGLDTSHEQQFNGQFESMGVYGTSPTVDLTLGEKMFYVTSPSTFDPKGSFDFRSIGTKLTTNSINSILQVAASVPRDGSVTNSLGNPIVGQFTLKFSTEQLGRADQDLVSAAQTAGYTIS